VLPDENTIGKFAERIESHLMGHLVPFWAGPALDPDCGGWHSWLTNDLRPDRAKPQGLIVNCRILWAFSALHRVYPTPELRVLAEKAFNLVFNRFWDSGCGGGFWRLNNQWEVIDDSKKTYGQAFYIYAMAEFYQAFGNQAALVRARALLNLIETRARDASQGGYWEVRQRDWSEAVDSRLSEKDMDEKKSMNNHLHVLEAYTNLYRAWPDPELGANLRELIGIFLRQILDASGNHFHHFFDESWTVRSGTRTYGHDIEGSWLLLEAAEVVGDKGLVEKVGAVAVRMAESVRREGLDVNGALSYEGSAGQVFDAGKECWPQAEALVGFINAWQLSGDARYFTAAAGIWDFIEDHLADRTHGEWFWRIQPDGQPDLALPKVSEWKGPYHGTRACLEAIRRLRSSHPTDRQKGVTIL
jgi:mannobiose 2-epimerase